MDTGTWPNILSQAFRISAGEIGACSGKCIKMDEYLYHIRIRFKERYDPTEFRFHLSLEYLNSVIVEPYKSGDHIMLDGRIIAPDEIYGINIRQTEKSSSRPSLWHRIWHSPSQFSFDSEGIDVTDTFISGPPGLEAAPMTQIPQASRPASDANEVFVVHGRNTAAREAMFQFLRAVGLDPLEWSEAVRRTGKASPYIGEILDIAFHDAHAVIVLFTPDDEARLREPLRRDGEPLHEVELTGQARPNVLFESGIAMGKNPDRTILVELGQLRPFSDIAGRHVLRFDGSFQQRQELARRLETAGCPVNLTRADWSSAGDFQGALALSEVDSSQTSVSNDQESETEPQHRLSDDAVELLVEGSKDPHGLILTIRTLGGFFIQANGRQFVEVRDPRSEARWRHALSKLVDYELVEDRTGGGTSFQVTLQGFQVADELSR